MLLLFKDLLKIFVVFNNLHVGVRDTFICIYVNKRYDKPLLTAFFLYNLTHNKNEEILHLLDDIILLPKIN